MKRWLIVASMMCAALYAHAATGSLLGHKLIRHADFYDANSGLNMGCIGAPTNGARLHVYFKNTSGSSITIQNFSINGTPFESLDDTEYTCGYNGGAKWWHAWPRTVSDQGVAAIWSFIPFEELAIGSGSITFTAHTSGGDINFNFDPEPTDLWIPHVFFSENLSTAVVYVANQGSSAIVLPSTGGIKINGTSRSGALPQTTVYPGQVVPVTLTGVSAYLSAGAMAILEVASQDGSEKAYGHTRVLASSFGVTAWQAPNLKWDERDVTNHHLNLDIPGWREFRDEPFSTYGGAPTSLARDVETAWGNQSGTNIAPLMIQMSSYAENLVGGDISDIGMNHHGNMEQDLINFLTWPKPVWYLPQNAWSHSEGINKVESWPMLDDLQFQAFDAIGRGAKNVQWFVYKNLWEQGYNLGGADDLTRRFQDMYMMGAIGNPLLWERVGRVSGVLQVLKPYLENSMVDHTDTVELDRKTHVVVCNTNHAVLVAMDAKTLTQPQRPYQTDAGDQRQRVLYDAPVRANLPAYLYNRVTEAYLVDPFVGVTNIPLSKLGGNLVEVTLPELKTAAMVLLGTASDEAPLQARWNTVKANLREADGLREDLLMRASSAPGGGWKYPELSRRVRVAVTNTGSGTASAIALPIDIPFDGSYSTNAFRVVEIDGDTTNDVSFYVRVGGDYETFDSADVATRCTVTNGSGYGVVGAGYSNDSIRAYFTIRTNTFNCIYNLNNPKPWGGTGKPWISSDLRTYIIDADLLQNNPAVRNAMQLRIEFDRNSNGTYDLTKTLSFVSDIPRMPLSNGLFRYVVDVEAAFKMVAPDEDFRGQWRAESIIHMATGSEDEQPTCTTLLDYIGIGGPRVVRVEPGSGGLPAGQSRVYEVYYDLSDNTTGSGTSLNDASLASATLNTNILTDLLAGQSAGATVQVSGASVAFETDAAVSKAVVRHLDADGRQVSSHTVTPSAGRQFACTLSRSPAVGESIAIIPVPAGGEGLPALFTHTGAPWVDGEPSPTQTWRHELNDDRYTDIYGTTYRTNTPYSIDISADGLRVAVGHAKQVTVLNNVGQIIWSKTYAGRVGFVRFAPDGLSLYVGANNASAQFSGSDWRIFKYNAGTGAESWNKQAGSGYTDAGRTLFDMVVYPDGDVGYSQWKRAAKLNGADGSTRWSKATSGYALDLEPMSNGDTLLQDSLGNYYEMTAGGSQNPATAPTLTNGYPGAIAAAPDGSKWAIAGNEVWLTDGNGGVQRRLYLGRNVRSMSFTTDGNYLAAGSCDGVASLVRVSDGAILWQKEDHGTYVTEVHFVDGTTNVVVVREHFDYSHGDANWRYREQARTYDLAGNLVSELDGGWRDQPFMGQMALSSNGNYRVLLNGEAVRYFDLSFSVGAPVISPAGGTFDDQIVVGMESSTQGATIRYTTDGSTPTEASALYGSPFTLATSTVVKARAFKEGMDPSGISEALFTGPRVYTPAILPAEGTYVGDTLITLVCDSTGVVMRYTTDGSTPTPSSTAYSAPFTITNSCTVRVIGYRTDIQSSEIAASAFTISQASGDLVAMWKLDEGAGTTAYDETDNNHDGTLNGASWDSTGRYGASARFDGDNDRIQCGNVDVNGFAATFCCWMRADDFGTMDARLLSKAQGTADADHWWMLSTLKVSRNYRLRFRLKTAGLTKTLVAGSGNLSSYTWTHVAAVYDGSYMILYKDGQEVGRMECVGAINEDDTVAAWIGGNPPGSRYFDGEIDDVRIYRQALTPLQIGEVISNTVSQSHVVDPSVYPDGGAFEESVDVTLASGTPGAEIRYTTDGSAPTESSALYTAPFTLNASATVKAKGFKTGMTTSGVSVASFTISEAPVEAPTFSPDAGTFPAAVTVELACATSGADIRYTTDGLDPTESSSLYATPLVLTTNTTVKARGFKTGLTPSVVSLSAYVIRDVTPPTAASNLRCTSTNQDAFAIAWNAGADNVGVTGYAVYRGGVLVGTTPSLTYTHDGLAPNTAYTTYVKTYDAGGNTSAPSASITVTTRMETVATPVITPNGASFTDATVVTVTCATAGSEIRYTTDQSDPTGASALYAGPITLTNSCQLKARGFKAGAIDSGVAEALFILQNHLTDTNGLWIEAESGTIEAGWSILIGDTNTSANLYVSTPQNTGANYTTAGDPLAGKCIVNFSVTAATYAVWVRVLAPTMSDDSFHAKMDQEAYALWDCDENSDWVWQKWANKTLTSGEHTLTICQREDGALIDRVLIANNLTYTPTGKGYGSTVQYWTLTVSAGANGTVTPMTAQVASGNGTNFMIAPAQYYAVGSILKNGQSVSPTTNFVWNDVMANGTLTVSFAEATATTYDTPHWWLAENKLTNGTTSFDQAETTDTDGDGVSAWAEYIAGTQPTNAGSVLAVTGAQGAVASHYKLAWPSVAGRLYSVSFSTNLGATFQTAPAMQNLSPTPPLNVFTDTLHGANTKIYYRIGVQKP